MKMWKTKGSGRGTSGGENSTEEVVVVGNFRKEEFYRSVKGSIYREK